MKKCKTVANILWALGVFSLLLVILEESNITHFLPIYLVHKPTTTEQINLSNTLTLSICCIGYLLLGISLVLKIVTATSTKKLPQTNKPIYIKVILISLKVVAVIFTLLIIAFSLLFAFFSFLILVVDFNTPQ
ncbi:MULTISPECIES: hypothetical protein [Actinomycetota]|uniref:Uncharacterized protein n=1 Tax=Fannyhessea vaginae DSM 15829 TaxID=525256 RepID=F1T6Z3_9ACTN|nr:hypothetical protein [Fannyhessea vaginae]MCT7863153.1 hypothetical protein [Lactobacillus crispatus]PNP90009.1 hypothetical protein BFS08_03590 [Gardnerella sp. KA00735]EGF22722.1 hypothetical protein HMPREF0091_11229 [Fannyhessea vaginae DSM 15829]KXG91093.1 hypothetical protein HMPREF3232_00200 [Fannyhessea vaginae]QPR41763.1 hypothetical protein I6G91_00160 [Fannyhessea vaginae]